MSKTISYQNFYKKTPKEFTKEDAKILVEKPEIPCKTRGDPILVGVQYIRRRYGIEGFRKFSQELKNFGYPINFGEIYPLRWYPVGLKVLCIVVATRVFDWQEEDIVDFGWNMPKVSFTVKFFFRFFLSKRTAWKEASRYWKKYYTTGRLVPIEFNKEKRYCTVRVYKAKIHPIYCIFYLGYFRRIAAYTFGENVTCQETKCMYKGDPYHEFLFKWP